MKNIKIFLSILLLAAGLQLNAQTKPSPVKYKAPKLYTQLGNYKDSVNITVAEAANIIGQSLKITDDKKVAFTVSSYQFLYRRKGVIQDEETGKTTPSSGILSSLFKTSPLPQLWIDQIRDQLKPGEELFFFAVIAKDAQGRVMYAPDLKIMVK